MKKCICRLMVLAVMLLAMSAEGFADVEINEANSLNNVSANYVYIVINSNNFPDNIFRNYVSINFDTDKDGMLSEEEISAATNIYVNSAGISSIKGVEFYSFNSSRLCR